MYLQCKYRCPSILETALMIRLTVLGVQTGATREVNVPRLKMVAIVFAILDSPVKTAAKVSSSLRYHILCSQNTLLYNRDMSDGV